MKTNKKFYSKKNVGLLSIFVLLLSIACSDDTKLGLNSQDNLPPPPPTVVKIENLNGAAMIYYQAPTEDDLLCITASYIVNGTVYTTKSSPYKDHLKVEGFGKKGDYKVTLNSIDKSNNQSVPVELTVSPLESPVEIIYSSINIIPSFGGVKLSWDNSTESNIVVQITLKDSIGDWNNIESVYTNTRQGSAAVRGLDTIPKTFGVTIRDRWDNYSPMLVSEIKPMYEVQLEKSKFREVVALPNDAELYSTGYPVSKIWDGNTTSSVYHTSRTTGIGNFVTFDMGQTAKLSRFKMYQRTSDNAFIYSHNNLKRYIIYGATEITASMRASGTIDGWTEICNVVCYKPSGDSGVVTNEDKEYILNGDEHEISLDAPATRYIRIHMLENWSGGIIAQIAEMTFWGQVINQ